MKESGLRIRVENNLREMFLAACRKEDQTAAQVLRAFMRSYIEQKTGVMQPDLFHDSLNINITKYGEQK